jgi:hypothetical protein
VGFVMFWCLVFSGNNRSKSPAALWCLVFSGAGQNLFNFSLICQRACGICCSIGFVFFSFTFSLFL